MFRVFVDILDAEIARWTLPELPEVDEPVVNDTMPLSSSANSDANVKSPAPAAVLPEPVANLMEPPVCSLLEPDSTVTSPPTWFAATPAFRKTAPLTTSVAEPEWISMPPDAVAASLELRDAAPLEAIALCGDFIERRPEL